MKKSILNKDNFDHKGVIMFDSLTIRQCYDIRQRMQEFNYIREWADYYNLNNIQAIWVYKMSKYIDNSKWFSIDY